MKSAVLGTGLLGSEIAIRLAARGFTVTVWNRSADKAAPLAAVGIGLADSAAAAIAGADCTLLLLSDAAAIRETLTRNGGNRTRTAQELGVSRNTLWRKMQRYGIR